MRDRVAAQIVDATVGEADAMGWSAFRFRRIAGGFGISLTEPGQRFRDKDEVTGAWCG